MHLFDSAGFKKNRQDITEPLTREYRKIPYNPPTPLSRRQVSHISAANILR